MTETHSLGEWEKEFDEYVKILMRRNNDMLVRSAASGFKILFEGMLLAQKEGFRREIEKEMDYYLKVRDGIVASKEYDYEAAMRFTAKRCALDDLLTKLDTNGI